MWTWVFYCLHWEGFFSLLFPWKGRLCVLIWETMVWILVIAPLVQPTRPDFSLRYEWVRRKIDVHLDTAPSDLSQLASFRQGLKALQDSLSIYLVSAKVWIGSKQSTETKTSKENKMLWTKIKWNNGNRIFKNESSSHKKYESVTFMPLDHLGQWNKVSSHVLSFFFIFFDIEFLT